MLNNFCRAAAYLYNHAVQVTPWVGEYNLHSVISTGR